jgi:hypothetical protein
MILLVLALAIAVPTGTTGDKPQSKVWYAHGSWWAALSAKDGLYLWKYDGALQAQGKALPGGLRTDACDALSVGDARQLSASVASIVFQ